MTPIIRKTASSIVLVAGALVLSACSSMMSMMPMASSDKVTLTGSNEVPAVTTPASGSGAISIAADGSVTGSITVTGMNPTMGHIHQAAAGVNGPVIVPLVQSGNVFTPAAGAKLTEVQMAAYRAGNLYVNVHSAAHPGGEVRAQLKPAG